MTKQIINETWKIIKDFPDYAVSDQGRVKRITAKQRTHPGKILKPNNSRRYLNVCLCKNKKRHMQTIHSLVLEAFHCPRPKGLECNHDNGIKTDNKITNLEWVTKKENNIHRIEVLGQKGEKSNYHKLTEKQVKEIRQRYIPREMGFSKLAKIYHVDKKSILNIIYRKTWKHL